MGDGVVSKYREEGGGKKGNVEKREDMRGLEVRWWGGE